MCTVQLVFTWVHYWVILQQFKCKMLYYKATKGNHSNKKELTTETYNNLDRAQGHHDEWKKPISKFHILHDCIYIIFSKWQNYTDGKHISDWWWLGMMKGKRWEWLERGSITDISVMIDSATADCCGGYTNFYLVKQYITTYMHCTNVKFLVLKRCYNYTWQKLGEGYMQLLCLPLQLSVNL